MLGPEGANESPLPFGFRRIRTALLGNELHRRICIHAVRNQHTRCESSGPAYATGAMGENAFARLKLVKMIHHQITISGCGRRAIVLDREMGESDTMQAQSQTFIGETVVFDFSVADEGDDMSHAKTGKFATPFVEQIPARAWADEQSPRAYLRDLEKAIRQTAAFMFSSR